MDRIKTCAKYALDSLVRSGATRAQVRLSSGTMQEFNVDGGQFSLMRTLMSHSLVLTAYVGGKKGTTATNAIDEKSVDAAAADAVEAAKSGVEDEAWDIAPLSENKSFTSGNLTPDRDKLFDRIKELVDDIKEEFPTILIEQLISSYNHNKAIYLNSNGVEHTEEAGYYDLSIMFSAHDGDNSSSFFGDEVVCEDLDTPFIDKGRIRRSLLEVTKQTDLKPFNGKFTGTAMLLPDVLCEFLSLSLGNFAGDTTLIDKTSPWKDSLGKTVADSRITISLAPLDKRIICGERVTGSGYISENYDVIKDGVLNSFMLSVYGSNKTGFPRAKNTSFSMVVKNGEKSLDEIIAGIDKGIFVGRFSGGTPGVNGEFSGVAKNSFLIENGKITNALSEVMINGNLADMLKNLREISSDTVEDGMNVMPYAAFDNITVSGR